MSNIIPLFNEYIGNDKIEEAVNLMLEFLVNRDAQLHGDFVLVKNRFSHFKREYKPGLTQDLSERVRIVHALLLLSEEVNGMWLKNPVLLHRFSTTHNYFDAFS